MSRAKKPTWKWKRITEWRTSKQVRRYRGEVVIRRDGDWYAVHVDCVDCLDFGLSPEPSFAIVGSWLDAVRKGDELWNGLVNDLSMAVRP